SDANVVFVGSGEADMRSSISVGNGMYKSTDAGKTWKQIGLSDSRQIVRIVVDPRDANRVFVAVLGHAYGPNQERGGFRSKEGGLYRSDDGGQNWQHSSKDHRLWGRGWYFNEVTVDPKDADLVYAPNTSIYVSRDGGKSFRVFKGDPTGPDYHELWIDPDD